MTGRILLTMLIMLTGACSGNRQQGVPTPAPKKSEAPVTETQDPQQDDVVDPFADLNKEQEKDDADEEQEDIDAVDDTTTDINNESGGGSSGLSTIVSMLPMITGLMSGQTPDIGSILGLMGGAGGAGGGGGLSGLTGLLGGTP